MRLQAGEAEVVRRREVALEAEQQVFGLLPHIRVRGIPHGVVGVSVEEVEKCYAREGQGQPVRHGHVPGELKDDIAGQPKKSRLVIRRSRTQGVPGTPEERCQFSAEA